MAPIAIKSVLISESVDPRCRSILEENGIRVTEKQNMKKDELIAEIKVSCALMARLLRYTRRLPPKLGVSNCISDQVTSFQTAAAAASTFMHGFDPCTGSHRAPYFTLPPPVRSGFSCENWSERRP